MLTEQKIPLGQYIAAFVDWLTQHGANYFDAIASTLETMIHGVTFALTWFNPLVLIGLIALLASSVNAADGNIEKISMDERDGRISVVQLVVSVHDRVHLARVIKKLRALTGVIRITRMRA